MAIDSTEYWLLLLDLASKPDAKIRQYIHVSSFLATLAMIPSDLGSVIYSGMINATLALSRNLLKLHPLGLETNAPRPPTGYYRREQGTVSAFPSFTRAVHLTTA